MTETVRQSICRTVLIVVDILFINLFIGRNILDKYKFIGQNKITFYNHRTRRERNDVLVKNTSSDHGSFYSWLAYRE